MRVGLILGLAALAVNAQDNGEASNDQADDDGSVRWVAENELDIRHIPLETSKAVGSPLELFEKSCPEFFPKVTFGPSRPKRPVLELSYLDDTKIRPGEMYASASSFIRGSVEAWARHQHLFLRPQEVWFEILAQLSFYMKKNSEQLRKHFVDHQGQREIKVEYNETIKLGTKPNMTEVIDTFGKTIQSLVKTPWLLDWVKPGFSGAKDNDDLVAQALLMGLMQKYFKYSIVMVCGLPSVTLLGNRADWVKLKEKTDRLKEWGTEPEEYARVLAPILKGFIDTFDNRDSPEVHSFWSNFIRGEHIAGGLCNKKENMVNGWITGFHFWDTEGAPFLTESRRQEAPGVVKLGDVTYFPRHVDELPTSYAKVPIKLNDIPATLVAGNIGIHRSEFYDEDSDRTLVAAEPLSGWYLITGSVKKARFPGKDEQDKELHELENAFSFYCPVQRST